MIQTEENYLTNVEQFLQIAINASIKAGEAIMSVYEGIDFEIELKEDRSYVTKADKLANTIIVDYLTATQIPILSEEGKTIPFDVRKNWKQLWIVDPLDGTKEFINRNGEFTVNIALVENQVPILGVILCPVLGVLYYGAKEIGSYKLITKGLNSKNIDLKKAVKLPLTTVPEIYTVVASRSHLSKETSDFIEKMEEENGKIALISKGSSVKFCLVAEGSAHIYPRFAPTMEWDTAAGQAICNYAGFTVFDWKTQLEKKYNNENLLNNWFVVK